MTNTKQIFDSIIKKTGMDRDELKSGLQDACGCSDRTADNWLQGAHLPRRTSKGVLQEKVLIAYISKIEEATGANLSEEREAFELLYSANNNGQNQQEEERKDRFITLLPEMLLGEDPPFYFVRNFFSQEEFLQLLCITNHSNNITDGLDIYYAGHPDHLSQAKARQYFESCFTNGSGSPLPGLSLDFWKETVPLFSHIPQDAMDIPPQVAVAVTDQYINHDAKCQLRMGCHDFYRFLKTVELKQQDLRTNLYGYVVYSEGMHGIHRILTENSISRYVTESSLSLVDLIGNHTVAVLDIWDFDQLLLDEFICGRSWECGDHYSKRVYEKLLNLVQITVTNESDALMVPVPLSKFASDMRLAREAAANAKKQLRWKKDEVYLAYVRIDLLPAARSFMEWMECNLPDRCLRYPQHKGTPFLPDYYNEPKDFLAWLKKHPDARHRMETYKQTTAKAVRI